MINAFSRRRVRKELKGAFAPIPLVRGAMARAVLDEMEMEAHDSVVLFLDNLSGISGSGEPLEDSSLGLLISRFFKVKRSPEAMELHGFIYGIELRVWLSFDVDSDDWRFHRLTAQTPADLQWTTTIPVKELTSSLKKPNRRIAVTNAWAALMHNEMLNLKTIREKIKEANAREGKASSYDREISDTSVRDGLIKIESASGMPRRQRAVWEILAFRLSLGQSLFLENSKMIHQESKIMRRVLGSACIIISVCLFGYLATDIANAKDEGWQFVKWGMTVGDVIGASDNRAVSVSNKEAADRRAFSDVPFLKMPYQSGEFTFVAWFKFNESSRKLTSVKLELTDPEQTYHLRKVLNDKYGKPDEQSADHILEQTTWNTPNTAVKLTIIGGTVSKPMTSVSYSARNSANGSGL